MNRRTMLRRTSAGLVTGLVGGMAGCSMGDGNGGGNGGGQVSGEIVENPYDALQMTTEKAGVREISKGGQEFTAFGVSGTATNTGDERLTSNRPNNFSFLLRMRVYDSSGTELTSEPSEAALTSLDPGQEAPWLVIFNDEQQDRAAQYEITVQ